MDALTPPALRDSHDFALLRSQVERRLADLLPAECHGLTDALRAVALAPGKRLRPAIVLLAGQELRCVRPALLDFACAVELIHAASLALDDLPCMDNATLRRGEPAAHLRFGQDGAILAAVSLLNHAYHIAAASPGVPPSRALALVRALTKAVGPDGLVRGQFDDLRGCPATCSPEAARQTNQRKTAALFLACTDGAAIIARVTDSRRERLRGFAAELGHAFQLLDDLLDRRAEIGSIGKNTGQDARRATVLALAGEAHTAALLQSHLTAALDLAAIPGGTGALRRFVAGLFQNQAALCTAT